MPNFAYTFNPATWTVPVTPPPPAPLVRVACYVLPTGPHAGESRLCYSDPAQSDPINVMVQKDFTDDFAGMATVPPSGVGLVGDFPPVAFVAGVVKGDAGTPGTWYQ